MSREHRARHHGILHAASFAVLLCGCHSSAIGPPPPNVQPRRFRIIIHSDGSMTQAIVEQRGGDPTVMTDDEKKDVVMPYLDTLLGEVNAIYSRNLGVSFYFHAAERDWIDTGPSPFGACGHASAAFWNNGLLSGMDDPPDLATMLVNCEYESSNSRGYSHWNGLCSGGFAESVVATGRRVDAPEFPRMVAHELGHLMGASHTFGIIYDYTNGDRHVEPGCGSTIMSYGGGMVDDGECDPSQGFVRVTDDYFHAYSIGEMQTEIADEIGRGACGLPVDAEMEVHPPSVDLRGRDDAAIPARTPFLLSATYAKAADDDLASSFDVSFDELDDDGDAALLGQDDGHDTIVRSRLFRDLPASGGTITRYVPRVADVLAGRLRPEESPAVMARSLRFRAMARAQHPYGASTGAADAHRVVVDTGRAFGGLTYPATVAAGAAFELRWDPAGTSLDPAFDAARVRFWLCSASCDEPEGYGVALADAQQRTSFANAGAAQALMPELTADAPNAHVMIENEGGTFFDVGRAPMRIVAR